jgi:hypothetical protein
MAVAFFEGGLLLVVLVFAGILVYATVFAVVATSKRGAKPSLRAALASNFRRALVDGPVFVLGFW